MLADILAGIEAWASAMGGVGLFVIAFLDSSLLSFPQVNDLLVIVLSAKDPDRMPYYAAMTTAGSLAGCMVLYVLARRGGEPLLAKRLNGRHIARALALYQRFGLFAVLVPALMPPPVPFKVFVVLAGASAVTPWRFAAAVIAGRGIRYFGQGYLAVVYGDRAIEMIGTYGTEVAIGLAMIALTAGVVYTAFYRRRQEAS